MTVVHLKMGDVRTTEKQLQAMHRSVKAAFSKVKEELDDHLDAINRNSTEIQSLYEYLIALERKMDKLAERLEEQQPVARYVVEPLTSREQEVFLHIYMVEGPVQASVVASQLGFSEGLVREYVRSMVAKGIPLLQQVVGDDVSFSLELRFREAQARQSLVRIDESVSRQVSQEQLV